jgi:ubiquinone/menaquinone biosynthesis C-methylase UbiE
MHSFAHHHRESHEKSTKSIKGLIINLGWRYDLMSWFCDTFLFAGKLRELRQRTANLACIQPGETVLDVGCYLARVCPHRHCSPHFGLVTKNHECS